MKPESLLRVLRMKPDEAACQAILTRLDEYIMTQIAGEDYVTLLPDVAFHLDACPTCANAYARLYELALADMADQLPVPERVPAPDLRFLGTAAPTLTDRLRAAIRHTADQVALYFSAELLPLLQPQPALATLRASEESGRYREQLLSLEPDESLYLPFGLAAYRDTQQPDKCLIEVMVEPPDRHWPDLGGTMVTLSVPTAQQQAITDEWGWVSFADVPVKELAQMVVRVAV